MTTGTQAPAATTFSLNRVSAATAMAPNTKLTAAAAVGVTSLSVGSILEIVAGQKVDDLRARLQRAGAFRGPTWSASLLPDWLLDLPHSLPYDG